MRSSLLKSALAAWLVASSLSACGVPVAAPLQALGQEEGLNFGAQATKAVGAIQLTRAQVKGQEAQLEYGVVRGGQLLRRKLVVSFNGDGDAPEAWKIERASMNGQALQKGKLAAADRAMLKAELAELRSQLGGSAKKYQLEAVGEMGALAAGPLSNPTTRNRVEFHVEADSARKALLSAIGEAKQSFYIETFIWHNDAIGREVADALAARKKLAERRGESFDIKILIDSLGLNSGGREGRSDTPIVEYLRAAGIEVRLFAPGKVDGGRFLPLTHRKLYIADASRFLTGGRNIGDEYLSETFEGPGKQVLRSWHDLLFSVTGEEVGRIRDEFFENWQRAGGSRPARLAPVVPAEGGRAAIETVTTDPHARTRGIREAHDRLIAGARKEIVVIYPYFSDDHLIDSLIAAKRKNPGLSLKVLLPGTSEPGREGSIYGTLNEESALQVLKVGAEVRTFDGQPGEGRFSHFKGMLVDDSVLSLGSANADARTYRANHELNTLIADADTVASFKRQVLTPDWNVAKPLTEAALKNVGLKRKVARKVLEIFDFLL